MDTIMFFTTKNILSTLAMCVVMAITLFLCRVFFYETALMVVNFVPYLLSALLGLALVLIYLQFFPSQRKDNFITFFIPGFILLSLLVLTDFTGEGLIDELMFVLSFIFGGQELSKKFITSLEAPTENDSLS